MRRIVQFIFAPEDSSGPASIIALCEDGTLWQFRAGQWKQFPEIPAPPPREDRRSPGFWQRPVAVKDENGEIFGFVGKERK